MNEAKEGETAVGRSATPHRSSWWQPVAAPGPRGLFGCGSTSPGVLTPLSDGGVQSVTDAAAERPGGRRCVGGPTSSGERRLGRGARSPVRIFEVAWRHASGKATSTAATPRRWARPTAKPGRTPCAAWEPRFLRRRFSLKVVGWLPESEPRMWMRPSMKQPSAMAIVPASTSAMDARARPHLEPADHGQASLDLARDHRVTRGHVARHAAALVDAADPVDRDRSLERARQLDRVAAGQRSRGSAARRDASRTARRFR